MSVRPHSLARRGLSASVVTALALTAAACGGGGGGGGAEPEATPSASAPPPSTGAPDGRAALAAVAAVALDRSYAALYALEDGSGPARNVVATVGADGTWKVDVAGGALGGSADVSIVSTAAGVFQCSGATTVNPTATGCVKVAEPGKRVPKAYSPRVERLFRQYLDVFTDRQSGLSVAQVNPLNGAQGTCYSVDSVQAALAAPVDVGIYCYADDGLLTAARVGYGTIKLVSQVAGPPTVQLPGPQSGTPAMGTGQPSASTPVG